MMTFILGVTAVLGLIVGSFLNVVIVRLPRMLECDWYLQSTEFFKSLALKNPELQTPNDFAATSEKSFLERNRINLCLPGSHCPVCKSKIAFYDNVPVLSYLLLRGKCRHCKTKISIRYPLVELLSAVLSVVVVLCFGFSFKAAAALVFVWALIALTFIDFAEQILPDQITLPILWLGLALNSQALFVSLNSAVFGAICGYLALWSVYWLFKLYTKKEGLGYGDFKLLAMIGAWLGVGMLSLTLLIASLLGSIIGITAILIGKTKRHVPISFGPYLALAALIALFAGDKIIQLYTSLLVF